MSAKPAPLAHRKSLSINWKAFEYYSRLKKVLLHVSEHPGESLSLDEAANIASLDYTYFSEYFHQKIGVNYRYRIDYVRVARAARLLQSGDKTVTEVAEECGFHDGTTFARTFRRVTGSTPSQFRNLETPVKTLLLASFCLETAEIGAATGFPGRAPRGF